MPGRREHTFTDPYKIRIWQGTDKYLTPSGYPSYATTNSSTCSRPSSPSSSAAVP